MDIGPHTIFLILGMIAFATGYWFIGILLVALVL
jgi:hypothetical protein